MLEGLISNCPKPSRFCLEREELALYWTACGLRLSAGGGRYRVGIYKVISTSIGSESRVADMMIAMSLDNV